MGAEERSRGRSPVSLGKRACPSIRRTKKRLKVLDLRWHDGQLLTREQIARQKAKWREAKQASKRWASRIAKWRRAISGDDAAARDEALAEIQSIKDADAIWPLEAMTLGSGRRRRIRSLPPIYSLHCCSASQMPAQTATESLVRHAVLSPVEVGRTKAIEELKRRQPHDFVPLLLSGLGMPIESSFRVHTAADGSIHYRHSLYREGQQSDWAVDARFRDDATRHAREGFGQSTFVPM